MNSAARQRTTPIELLPRSLNRRAIESMSPMPIVRDRPSRGYCDAQRLRARPLLRCAKAPGSAALTTARMRGGRAFVARSTIGALPGNSFRLTVIRKEPMVVLSDGRGAKRMEQPKALLPLVNSLCATVPDVESKELLSRNRMRRKEAHHD